MRIFKRLALILALVMVTSLFTACSKDSSKEASSVNETKKTEKKNNKEKNKDKDTDDDNKDGDENKGKESKDGNKDLSNELKDFQVSIEDQVYTLPLALSEFLKMGWESEELDEKLKPNSTINLILSKSIKTLKVTITNFSIDMLPYSECVVVGVIDTHAALGEKTKIVLSKGISLNSSYDDIIKAYGNPSDEYIDKDYMRITYDLGSESKYAFVFNRKELTKIEVKNIVEPEGFSNSNTPSSIEIPEEIKNYKAPTSIGDNLDSTQLKFDGAIYKLPVPIQELEKNGWKLETDPNQIVPAKNTVIGIKLSKDNQILLTEARNYSDLGMPLKYCFATTIQFSSSNCNVSFELPKGITEKSTINDIIAAYGEPKNKVSNSKYTEYTYGSLLKSVQFSFEGNKGEKMIKMRIDNSSFELE